MHVLSRKVYQIGHEATLETCQQKTSHSEYTAISRQEQAGKTFLLLVEEQRPSVFYWMYLALTADTTLAALDQFLRDIWLEDTRLDHHTIANTPLLAFHTASHTRRQTLPMVVVYHSLSP